MVVVTPGAFEVISKNLDVTFPATPKSFLSSVAYRLLDHFSVSLLFATYPSAEDEPAHLRDHRRYFELALPVLTTLSQYSFLSENAAGNQSTALEDNGVVSKSPKMTQRNRKKAIAKQTQGLPAGADVKVFSGLGVRVPSSKEEVEHVATEILTHLKIILEVCNTMVSLLPLT